MLLMKGLNIVNEILSSLWNYDISHVLKPIHPFDSFRFWWILHIGSDHSH